MKLRAGTNSNFHTSPIVLQNWTIINYAFAFCFRFSIAMMIYYDYMIIRTTLLMYAVDGSYHDGSEQCCGRRQSNAAGNNGANF